MEPKACKNPGKARAENSAAAAPAYLVRFIDCYITEEIEPNGLENNPRNK